MTKFKVGDQVRLVGANLGVMRDGDIGTVAGYGPKGHVRINQNNRENGWDECWFELVANEATDELATLRVFRERALARHPDLAEPETDEEAAERIAKKYMDPIDAAIDAIAWARANPR